MRTGRINTLAKTNKTGKVKVWRKERDKIGRKIRYLLEIIDKVILEAPSKSLTIITACSVILKLPIYLYFVLPTLTSEDDDLFTFLIIIKLLMRYLRKISQNKQIN